MYLSVMLLNGLSAAAEIPIYVCSILYSCSFNNHIHYQATVINTAKKREENSATEVREISQETYI